MINYKKGLKMLRESNFSSDVFGDGSIGTFGGAVGNDARAYGGKGGYVLPATYLHPREDGKKQGKSKSKKKDGRLYKMPLYRRKFIETMNESVQHEPESLNCLIYTEHHDYQQVISDVLHKYDINYKSEENAVIIEGSDEYIQNVIEKIQGILTEEPFEQNEVIALIGEMDNDSIADDNIPGGIATHKTLEDFYKKYDPKSQHSIKDFENNIFMPALQKGIKTEMEHTTDEDIAKEIATDHLWEDLEYYDKLSKIEKKQ